MDLGYRQKALRIFPGDTVMSKKTFYKICFYLFLSVMLSACGTSPSSGGNSGASQAEAQALAQSALDRMDGGGQPSSGQQVSSSQPASPQGAPAAQAQQAAVSTGAKPAWVDSVDSVYNRSQYLAAVGNASDRTMAERNALGNLAAFFGQSIYADRTITNTYQEAVRNGVTSSWSDNIAMDNTIRTSASMDTLVGAEIRAVWFDSRSTYYAVAVLEKARTAQVYRDLIIANQGMIRNLLEMDQNEKNSFEGYSRYQFAAAVADINISYMNVINILGFAPPDGIKDGNEYRLEAQNIIRAIPIGITIKNNNDRAGRIQNAFAKAISDMQFRSGPANSRYVLVVDMTVSQADLPNDNNYIYARMELNANLTDTSNGQVLRPYSFGNPPLREGHRTLSEAENRLFTTAERKIDSEYADFLRAYLSRLLPVK